MKEFTIFKTQDKSISVDVRLENETVWLEKKIVEIRTIEEKKSKLLAKIDLIHKLQVKWFKLTDVLDKNIKKQIKYVSLICKK